MKTILDYTADQDGVRSAQLARLAQWKRPEWSEHVATMLDFVAHVDPRRPALQSSWSRTIFATSVRSTQAMKPANAVSAVTSQRIG